MALNPDSIRDNVNERQTDAGASSPIVPVQNNSSAR